jgi:prolyl-tRNA synthetase
VPFRIELGERDVTNQSVMICRRDNFEKTKCTWADLVVTLNQLIDTMHNSMLGKKIRTRNFEKFHKD